MDALNQLLQTRKNNPGGSSWVSGKDRRRQRENQTNDKDADYSKRLENAKRNRIQNFKAFLYKDSTSIKEVTANATESATHTNNSPLISPSPLTSVENQNAIETLTNATASPVNKTLPSDAMPVQECIQHLRDLQQPITLFGESHLERVRRLKLIQKKVQKEAQSDLNTSSTDANDPNSASNTSISVPTQLAQLSDSTTSKSNWVRNWIKEMLSEWELELQNRDEKEKTTSKGRQASNLYRQTKSGLRPLTQKLKSDMLEVDVLDRLVIIVNNCRERQYRDAHDGYMLLAIGNAAWPMGVTMVGIHERAGRSKIATSEVAHILNDETTRKYIQMFKRLMSFAQRRYPTDPSRMVSISTVTV